MAVSLERLYEAIRTLTIEVKELKQKQESNDIVSLAELCQILGVTDRNLCNHVNKLNIPTYRMTTPTRKVGKPYFKKSDLCNLKLRTTDEKQS